MSEKVPNSVLEELRKSLDPTPVGIVRDLVRAGYEAYIVGGAIRDLLLGKTPKDYDISTSATPEQVRAVFGRRRCHVIGRRFRLAHVYGGRELYEVSTFRRQPNEQERQGRKHDDGPMIWNDNCFGTLEDDAKRRDFTVNALYFDVTGHRGVIDFSGGYEDIKKGVVRCIGKPAERMAEDPVRMLRALKLVGQCGFRLEPALEAVIRANASAIRLASPARLFEELLKLLANPSCDHTLQVMHDHGFLREFWPTVDESWEEQEGVMMRHLLKLRGEAIRRGHYSNSRGLALSTIALPFLMSALNPEKPAEFWEGNAASDPLAHQALGIVFEGITVPRMLSERTLQIVGLVPRLLRKPVATRFLNHPEYRYGRALCALVVQLFGWDSQLLADLPEFSPRYNAFDEDEEPEEWEETLLRPAIAHEDGTGEVNPRYPGLLPLTKTAAKAERPSKRGRGAGAKKTEEPVAEDNPSLDDAAETAVAPVVEKAAPAAPKRRRPRKKTVASPNAPENSPALNEGAVEPSQAETPVVTAPPPAPGAAFFDSSAVFLPAEPAKKTRKSRKPAANADSITFG